MSSPQKVTFSLPIMCNTCCNHENRSLLVKCPLLKKWHSPHLVVTITTGFSYSNRSLLKKWHFLELVCANKFEFQREKKRTRNAQHRFARPVGVHKKLNRALCFTRFCAKFPARWLQTCTKLLNTCQGLTSSKLCFSNINTLLRTSQKNKTF